jgi:hypothetical protein
VQRKPCSILDGMAMLNIKCWYKISTILQQNNQVHENKYKKKGGEEWIAETRWKRT